MAYQDDISIMSHDTAYYPILNIPSSFRGIISYNPSRCICVCMHVCYMSAHSPWTAFPLDRYKSGSMMWLVLLANIIYNHLCIVYKCAEEVGVLGGTSYRLLDKIC